MADQTKEPKIDKAPAPPPVKTVARGQASGTFPVQQAPPPEGGKPEAAQPEAAKPQPPAKAPPPQKPEKRKSKAESEQLRLKKEEQARRSRRRNRQFIGLAVAILVVVGAVSIVMNGINMARNLFDDSGEMDEYQNRFKAFVWFDMLPFDSVSQVDENSIKQVVIWSIFDDQGDTLTRNEKGEAMVPASEVDLYGAEIFGPDFRFSGHSEFYDPVFDLKYEFDPETQMYAVPSTSLNNNYLPRVMEVVREPGGVRRVVMGYVSAINSDNQVMAVPDYDHPVRYMDYLLRRDGSGYYLYAIQNNTTYAAAASSSSGSASVAESLPELGLEDPLLADGPAVTSDPVEAEQADTSAESLPPDDSSTSEDSSAA